jgi:hypothetical protein
MGASQQSLQFNSLWSRLHVAELLLLVSTLSCLQKTHAIAPSTLRIVTALEEATKQQQEAMG